MKKQSLKVKKVSRNWFMGRGLGVVFFAPTIDELAMKHWQYMQSTSMRVYWASCRRTAEKMIQAGAI